jgi:hypothetical protein
MAWARKTGSGRWQGQYRDTSDRTRSVGTFLRKTDAVDAARKKERRVRVDGLDPDLERLTVAEYAENWLKTKGKVRSRTLINVEGRLRNHILPRFGDARVAASGRPTCAPS